MKEKSYEQGLVKGRVEGRVEGLAVALLTVLTCRGLEVSDQLRHQILETSDVDTLDSWLRKAAVASSLEDIVDLS